jgi:hypothetical protein
LLSSNIVAHSKGGLDARVYLANNSNTRDVANLAMHGTSDGDDTLASPNDSCSAAKDFVINAPATHALKIPTPTITLLLVTGIHSVSHYPQQWFAEFVKYEALFVKGSESSNGICLFH